MLALNVAVVLLLIVSIALLCVAGVKARRRIRERVRQEWQPPVFIRAIDMSPGDLDDFRQRWDAMWSSETTERATV